MALQSYLTLIPRACSTYRAQYKKGRLFCIVDGAKYASNIYNYN
jgi:hypothetical protein